MAYGSTFRYGATKPDPKRFCGKPGRYHDARWVPDQRTAGVWWLRVCRRCERICDYCPPPVLRFEGRTCTCGLHAHTPNT